MNEIEKMYDNANVEKHLVYFECHRGRSSFRKCPIYYDERDERCFYCFCENKMKEVYEYPPFTAEKQIKIENVILRNENNYRRWIEYSINAHGKWVVEFMDNSGINITVLEETRAKAFANIINNLWKNLTEEKKQQIKGILEV